MLIMDDDKERSCGLKDTISGFDNERFGTAYIYFGLEVQKSG